MRKIHIGQKVINSDTHLVGVVLRFYTPTSCREQTVVKTDDGREYHAPTIDWIPYQYGNSEKIIRVDELPTIPLNNAFTTLVVPNRDSYLGNYTVCPKEVLQKAYVDKVGSNVDFCGRSMLVKEVKITDESISIIMVNG